MGRGWDRCRDGLCMGFAGEGVCRVGGAMGIWGYAGPWTTPDMQVHGQPLCCAGGQDRTAAAVAARREQHMVGGVTMSTWWGGSRWARWGSGHVGGCGRYMREATRVNQQGERDGTDGDGYGRRGAWCGRNVGDVAHGVASSLVRGSILYCEVPLHAMYTMYALYLILRGAAGPHRNTRVALCHIAIHV